MYSRICLGLVAMQVAVLLVSTKTHADEPASTDTIPGICEMMFAKPTLALTHSFETKSLLDKKKSPISVKGPLGFSHPVDGQKTDRPAYLNWYKITYGGGDTEHQLNISLPQQDRVIQAKVGSAEFFLTPTQKIQDGPPSESPESLGLFKAYKVLSIDGWKTRDVRLEGTFSGLDSVSLSEAVYVCVPTEEFHHDEVFEIKDATACWIVFKSENSEAKTKVTTIDQLGMQKLVGTSSQHVLVPANLKKPE